MPDPFAQYAVANDPFAAFAETPPEQPSALSRFGGAIPGGIYDSTIGAMVDLPGTIKSVIENQPGNMLARNIQQAVSGQTPEALTMGREMLTPEGAGRMTGMAIGGYATGKMLPIAGRAIKAAPKAMASTGASLESLGESIGNAPLGSRMITGASVGANVGMQGGLAGTVAGGLTGGAMGAAAPAALRATGRMLQKAMPKPAAVTPEVIKATQPPVKQPLALKPGVYEMPPAEVIDVTPVETPKPTPEPVAAKPVAPEPAPAAPEPPYDPTPIRNAEIEFRKQLIERFGMPRDRKTGVKAQPKPATEPASPIQSQLRASLAERTKPMASHETPKVEPASNPATELRQALTDAAIKMRSEMGSRDAARAVGLTRDQFKKLAPAESKLPERAARQIDARLAGMTPEQQKLYLEIAPNEMARAYIKQKLGL